MTPNLIKDILEPTIIAAFVSGFVSLIAASLTAFVALRTTDRQIQIDNITKERAKWRDKIRDKAGETYDAWSSTDTIKLRKLRVIFAVNLNPFHIEDNGILAVIDRLGLNSNEEIIREFSNRVSLLLKHDWERAKHEAKPWLFRFVSCSPRRTPYEEFLKQQPPKN
jgi:hypothetical protein